MPANSIPTNPLARAAELQRAGDTAAAEQTLRDWLNQSPASVEGWRQLSSILRGKGQFPEAISCCREALRLDPSDSRLHNLLGITQAAMGDRASAADSFRKSLELRADFAPAYSNLGNVLKEMGKLDEAIENYRTAVRLQPDFAEGHSNLGGALQQCERFEEAVISCRTAARINPKYADAHYNLGLALEACERQEAALSALRETLRLNPAHKFACIAIGRVLRRMGRGEEAAAHLRQAISRWPGEYESHHLLALALMDLGQFDESLEAAKAAVKLKPDSSATHVTRGLIATEAGRYDQAMAEYDAALRLNAGDSQALSNRSMLLLLLGDLQNGWQEYENRFGTKELPHRNFGKPPWDGTPLNGRRILVHAEQGLGDTLQFVRFIPHVIARGGRVILCCPKSAVPFLAGMPGVEEVVEQGPRLPAFDEHIPLLSIPGILRIDLTNIPAKTPYLFADPAIVDQWRSRIASEAIPGAMKIGICWQGSRNHRRDKWRSIPLPQFLPLASLPGVQLFSLQKGEGREQLSAVRGLMPIVDLGKDLDTASNSITDLAAAMNCLDLIITCDSGPAHLAGAMGLKTWVALPRVPDWRWLLDRPDSPWYPTMRLFRQHAHDEWAPVFQEIAQALRSVL